MASYNYSSYSVLRVGKLPHLYAMRAMLYAYRRMCGAPRRSAVSRLPGYTYAARPRTLPKSEVRFATLASRAVCIFLVSCGA